MRPGVLAAVAAAAILSVAVNAGLFSFLPALAYWRQNQGKGPEDRARETRLVPLPMLPKKKEKPKAEESREKPARKASEPGKALARQRFVMDLGVGGGGAAVSAAEAGRPDLEQAAFEEGETDQDAQALRPPVQPRMPKEAEKAGVRDVSVKCILTIGEDGTVVHVEFVDVPHAFGYEQAIRDAIREDRYRPAMAGGVPVRQRIEMTYRF